MQTRSADDGRALPGEDRIPLGRLALLLALLIAGPIALVVALAHRPAGEADSSAATAPTTTQPTGTPAGARHGSSRERRPAPPAPRPQRSRSHGPTAEAASPASAAEKPAAAIDVGWRVTVASWGAAAHSPWAALSDEPAAGELPVLPAPINSRYVVLAIELEMTGPSRALLRVADRPEAPATVRLLVDGGSVPPLGRLTDPPDLFAPFDVRPMEVHSESPSVQAALAFLVSTEARSVRMQVGGKTVETLALPAETIPPDRIAGTWRKYSRQRVGLRYADPVMDAVCSFEHQVLAVRRAAAGQWLFDFPFTELAAGPATAEPGGALVELVLARAGQERRVRARLAESGQVLVLYLGDDPSERLAYRHRGP